MKLVIKKSLLTLFLAIGAFAIQANAHELRYIGNGYLIQVGDHVEPPVTGQPNGMDIFAFHETTIGDISTAVGLDKTAGDVVEVVSIPFKLTSESFNAPIAQIFPLLTTFTESISEGYPVYTANFTFPSVGAYGFLVSGKIKKQGHANKFFVEKFVCGAGSQDTIYGTYFECVAS